MSEQPAPYLTDRDPADETARGVSEVSVQGKTGDNATTTPWHGRGIEPGEAVMARQALPTPGRQAVTPHARAAFNQMLSQREAAGIATYGTTLQTHNGRDAHRDLAEELIDAWQYAKQAEMERADLLGQLTDLIAECDRFARDIETTRGVLSETSDQLSNVTAMSHRAVTERDRAIANQQRWLEAVEIENGTVRVLEDALRVCLEAVGGDLNDYDLEGWESAIPLAVRAEHDRLVAELAEARAHHITLFNEAADRLAVIVADRDRLRTALEEVQTLLDTSEAGFLAPTFVAVIIRLVHRALSGDDQEWAWAIREAAT